jgi:putative ABC transport system permease protein
MFKNYVTLALRILNRHRGYSFINIFGLAFGLAAGAFAILYAASEFSYDNFHTKRDRTYRVLTSFTTTDQPEPSLNNTNGWPIGYVLADEFPEVEKSLYMRSGSGFSLNYNGGYVDEQIRLAGPDFFEIFDFPLVAGDPRTVLSKPFSMVLSERMAQKYFPKEDPIGKILTANDSIQFTITGLSKNPPSNSHIQYDILVSFATWEDGRSNQMRSEGWFNINMLNYIVLREGVDVNAFKNKARSLYMDKAGEQFKEFGYVAELAFEPITETYLYSSVFNPLGPKGKFQDLIILCSIAGLIILLATINFVNLATARSIDRAKEVGLRKTSGSTQARLIYQFLSESLVTTLISLLLAIVLLSLALPLLNIYTEKNFIPTDLIDFRLIGSMLLLWIIVGLAAGFYPAWILSRFAPMQVLRGNFKTSTRGIALRRSLVVAQFFISAILVSAVFLVGRQLEFMQSHSLGFNKEQVLVVKTGKLAFSVGVEKYPVFKSLMLQEAPVMSVSASNGVPGTNGWRGQVAYAEGNSPEQSVDTEYLAVDADYVSLLNLKLLTGRNFKNDEADRTDGLLINEATAIAMGWGTAENAIGKRILSPSGTPAGLVLGVFKDYHQHGLQEKIQPVVMDLQEEFLSYYLVRFQPGTTSEVVALAEKAWKSLYPGYEFKYTFLDDAFAQQYQSEEKLGDMFFGFASMALLIAAIGLVGLSAFMIVHRTKEIGIRKVLGAKDLSILSLLTKDFVLWVVIANLLTWPLLYWLGNQWLEQFAFKTSPGIELYIWPLGMSLLITLLAISFQALRTIRMNPTQALRAE